jgi:hypothetical protein
VVFVVFVVFVIFVAFVSQPSAVSLSQGTHEYDLALSPREIVP